MRLIDADALMETIRAQDYPLRSYFNSTDRGMFTVGIQQAVDEQPTVTASTWHRVEDALPEEDVEVLISYRYKEGEGDTSHVDIDITSYGQMYFGGREVAGVKHWRPPFEYFSSNYEVIAWMPIEPPKEDA